MINQTKRYFSNPLKAILAALITVFFAAFSAYYYSSGKWIEAIVFNAVAVAFTIVFYIYGSMLVISKKGVSLQFLFIKRRHLSWDQIKEVGIIGERVLIRGNSNKVGSLYIYFSPYTMDDSDRFQLGLKWPPKRILYTVYQEETLSFIQLFWESEIALYNVGKLEL